MCVFSVIFLVSLRLYRVAKTHRMPYLYRSFSAKSPIICGSFAENDLQLQGRKASYGSSPFCTHMHVPARSHIIIDAHPRKSTCCTLTSCFKVRIFFLAKVDHCLKACACMQDICGIITNVHAQAYAYERVCVCMCVMCVRSKMYLPFLYIANNRQTDLFFACHKSMQYINVIYGNECVSNTARKGGGRKVKKGDAIAQVRDIGTISYKLVCCFESPHLHFLFLLL